MKRRTQVLFEEDEYRRLKETADRRNLSLSALIRERIQQPIPPRTTSPRNALMELAAIGEGFRWKKPKGDPCQEVDEVLYGKPRRK